MAHAFVTVVVPFDDSNAAAVNTRLDVLGNPARAPLSAALNARAFVHFMSLTVVRASPGEPAHLVLEVAADGHAGGVVNRLADTIGDVLRWVLEAAGVPVAEEELRDFLRRHDRQVGQGWFSVPGAVFSGTPGMSVVRIRREAKLAARIQQLLDDDPPQGPALATLQRLRGQLFGEGVYKWAFVAEPVPLLADAPTGWRVVRPVLWSALRTFLWPLLILPVLALFWMGWLTSTGWWSFSLTLGVELVLAIGAAGVAYARLRRKEKTDRSHDEEPSADAVGRIMARENKGMQNHLAAVSTMKPGLLRRLTLRLILWFVGISAHYDPPGTLSNIGTIHFAKWILLPGTNQLLFFSNYTGSWESYLEDFIMRAHNGLTGIWSNTRDFPSAKNLVQGGASAADPFKRWARRQQEPSLFWYTAYPGLTTHRIRTNAAIRHGFVTASTEAEAARWLRDFRFAPPRPTRLESEHVPTLAFTGLPALRHGQSLVLRLSDEASQARDWLASIELEIGYGERRAESSTLVLALSASGLRSLGLDDDALSTFSTAFQHGMYEPWRSRALGDVDENAPERWWWGSPTRGTRADAILNVYAATERILQHRVAQRKAQFQKFGITLVHEIVLDELPPKEERIREPFGFTDGVSQPIVRGTRKWVAARNDNHVVEPGEMVLGYEDNLKQTPACPSSARCPELGHNGTYLVVRQLEQNTEAFSAYLRDTADSLIGDPRVPRFGRQELVEWLAAKIVGRWPDGTSLVRYPYRPGSESTPGTPPDNDFLFGTEDPDGLRCPFGAHIRRANPRDSLEAGSKEQLAISNRHRIFRVGRSYSPQNQARKPGLLFMCVNANIERQFEFMQQTYMLGSSFHGLENEVDSFARRAGSSGVLTIPTERGPLRLLDMRSFVTMRGGAYFFMPGRSAVRFLMGGG